MHVPDLEPQPKNKAQIAEDSTKIIPFRTIEPSIPPSCSQTNSTQKPSPPSLCPISLKPLLVPPSSMRPTSYTYSHNRRPFVQLQILTAKDDPAQSPMRGSGGRRITRVGGNQKYDNNEIATHLRSSGSGAESNG